MVDSLMFHFLREAEPRNYQKMKVDLRKKVSSLQNEFRTEFGVGIRVYNGAKFADDVALNKIAKKSTGGAIDFGGRTLVKTVEKAFMDNFGIKVQVETKDGKLANDDVTLASLKK